MLDLTSRCNIVRVNQILSRIFTKRTGMKYFFLPKDATYLYNNREKQTIFNGNEKIDKDKSSDKSLPLYVLTRLCVRTS